LGKIAAGQALAGAAVKRSATRCAGQQAALLAYWLDQVATTQAVRALLLRREGVSEGLGDSGLIIASQFGTPVDSSKLTRNVVLSGPSTGWPV
jgi:hypothetical protein